MSNEVVQIRSYRPSDEKQVRFAVGKANLEQLAVANHKACTHPLTVVIWSLLSYSFISVLDWWPNGGYGVLGYLRPLPALACTALPLMFLVDWINRPDFEKHARKVLRGRDLQDIASYYSHPGSGFWILEKGSYLVGLIALDSEPNATDNSVEVKVPRIRHFYVEEAYRGVGVQSDLLQHVLKFAFDHGGVQEIRVVASPLLPYIQRCLSAAGFTEEGYPDEPMGILKWRLTYKVLERANWRR